MHAVAVSRHTHDAEPGLCRRRRRRDGVDVFGQLVPVKRPPQRDRPLGGLREREAPPPVAPPIDALARHLVIVRAPTQIGRGDLLQLLLKAMPAA